MKRAHQNVVPEELLLDISLAGTKPGVLSSSSYISASSLEAFLKKIFLKSHHKPSYLQLQYNELLEVCETVFESLIVTVEIAACIC